MNKFVLWIKNTWVKAKAFFVTAKAEVVAELPAVQAELVQIFGETAVLSLEATAKNLLKDGVGKLVMDVVVALQATEFSSNVEKRNAAYKQVVADLASQGKSISESLVNLLLEMAVLKLKTL